MKKKEEANGCPIYNITNKKILGFQKDRNMGILIKLPLNEFVEKDNLKVSQNKTIFKSLKKALTKKSTIKVDEGILNNEIGIIYSVLGLPEVLNLFGEQFVENNKSKYKLILYNLEKEEEFEYEFCSNLKLDFKNKINPGKPLFKIFLIQTDYLQIYLICFINVST